MKAPPSKSSGKVIWHPAFIEALQMELQAYRDVLEFYPEYQLTAEPLKIDCVIIKKAKGAVIRKNIAAIFREWNLVEYKSPGDYVSIDDFYKVYGYACLYTSFKRLPITDLALIFVESRYPQKLFRHLRNERGYTVEESSPGIYAVCGDILPIQIIDSRRLSAEDNVWLKSLNTGLDRAALNRIDAEIARQDKDTRVDAYMDVIIRANLEVIEEATNMGDYYSRIERILEKSWERSKQDGRIPSWAADIKAEEKLEIARKMKALGDTAEKIHTITGLPMESIKSL